MLDAPASLTVSFIDFPFLKGLIVSFLLVGFIFNLIIVLTCKKNVVSLFRVCESFAFFLTRYPQVLLPVGSLELLYMMMGEFYPTCTGNSQFPTHDSL
ncbi:Uncharacterised protein [Yersinia enterocolitica]|nr:Uncharacterised protein [Yersinia enterocolitica]